ncbi:GTP-binding protein RAD-like [Tachypleus tridentatus]|uniref:GTP-binding protein RAD-like n=1 Tax=Tachypleus tridentatus TaxID=6853 RepID=UPI003FCF50DA
MTSYVPRSAPDLRRLSCVGISYRTKRGSSLTPAMEKYTQVQNISSSTAVRRNSQQRPLETLHVPFVKDLKYKKTERSHSMQSSSRLINCDSTSTLLFRQRFASYPSDVRHLEDSRCSCFVRGDCCCRRIRNFSVTSKGVMNQGDSFRSSSFNLSPLTSQAHSSFKYNITNIPSLLHSSLTGEGDISVTICTVVISGSSEVGKSFLTRQFTTSEYMCTYDNMTEESDSTEVTVVLNEEESILVFTEQTLTDDEPPCTSYNADCHVVVYSTVDRSSFQSAKYFLDKLLDSERITQPIVLVGNKTDLVRLRSVTTNEGRKLAREYGCKFIETSACINYHLDELLVGVVTQIRLKFQREQQNQKIKTSIRSNKSENRKNDDSLRSKYKTLSLTKLLERLLRKSRSCDDFNVL